MFFVDVAMIDNQYGNYCTAYNLTAKKNGKPIFDADQLAQTLKAGHVGIILENHYDDVPKPPQIEGHYLNPIVDIINGEWKWEYITIPPNSENAINDFDSLVKYTKDIESQLNTQKQIHQTQDETIIAMYEEQQVFQSTTDEAIIAIYESMTPNI